MSKSLFVTLTVCLLLGLPLSSGATTTSPEVHAGDPLVVDARSGLNLRPRPNSGFVGVIPNGTTIYATGEPQSFASGQASIRMREWVPVKFLNESNEWIEGWVMLRYTEQATTTAPVTPDSPPPTLVTQAPGVLPPGTEANMTMRVNTKSRARLRAGPSTSSPILDRFTNDTRVNVIGPPQGDWIPVQEIESDARGWVHSSLLQATTGELNPLEVAHHNATPPAQTLASIDEFVSPEGPSAEAQPEGSYGAMRHDPVAAGGSCLLRQVTTEQQARALMRYYNVTVVGATATEVINLANGYFQASALYGGRFEPLANLTFKFSSRTGSSRYLADSKTIDLNRCNRDQTNCGGIRNINVARLMHEAGHAFGHANCSSGTQTYYSKFGSDVSGCNPTSYADDNVNENVAEIFSAFLTYPTRLSRGSAACQRAYRYLAEEVFKGHGSLASCDTLQKQLLLAEIQGLGSAGSTVAFENVFAPRTRTVEAASPALPTETAVQAIQEL